MFKEFLMKKMLQAKLKDVPKDQQEKLMAAITKNPELFKKMGEKIKEKTKGGMNEMMASVAVAKEFQDELREAMK